MSFAKLGLSPALVSAVAELGYQSPTPIQQRAIPAVMQGRDLLAAAQTGTGKTAAFGLPLLQVLSGGQTQRKKRVRALVLAPTRELVAQVASNLQQFAAGLPLKIMAMYGGTGIAAQKQQLIDGVDVLVATPGRLLDMYSQRAVYFEEVTMLVLDEADRMLDMGFIDDINRILERLPSERQNLLFSATLSPRVRALAKTAIANPVEIAMAMPSKTEIEQWLVTVDKDKKSALLAHLIQTRGWQQSLIFIETKHGAAKLVEQLAKRGIVAESFHSGRSQAVREQLLADFKSGAIQYLVATGVAARGIDIDNLPRVVNYDLPFPPDEYIHRIGRTGRAGQQGEAVSLLSKDDFKNLCMIESRLGHLLTRVEVEGFAPRKPVPVSILNYVPKSRRQDAQGTDTPSRPQPKLQPRLGSRSVSSRNNYGHTGNPGARDQAPKSPWSQGGAADASPWQSATQSADSADLAKTKYQNRQTEAKAGSRQRTDKQNKRWSNEPRDSRGKALGFTGSSDTKIDNRAGQSRTTPRSASLREDKRQVEGQPFNPWGKGRQD